MYTGNEELNFEFTLLVRTFLECGSRFVRVTYYSWSAETSSRSDGERTHTLRRDLVAKLSVYTQRGSPRGSDGIQTGAVGLSGLVVVARGDDTVGLSLPVGHLATVIDHDVARLSCCVGANDTLNRDHLADHRVLGLVGVEGDVRLVIVWVGLEEVLL